MGLLGNVLTGRPLRAEGWSAWDDRWYQPIGGGVASSGVRITPETALQHSAVWAAVRLLADSLAMLPLIIYRRRSDGGKERAIEHPLYDLLHGNPNPLQTSFAWKRVSMVHALLWGNSYSLMEAGARGPVDRITPLHPDGVRVEKLPSGGRRYLLRQADGTQRAVNDEDVFHLAGLSLDGLNGLSVMQYAREAVGLGLAAEGYQGRMFGQNARPGGLLKTAGKLSKDTADRLAASWQAAHAGVSNSHKVAVLEEGLEWQQTGMTSEDAAILGSLDWSATAVARFFNVPLHLIQMHTKSTSWGSGIEQLSQGFVTYSLGPWVTNVQEQISKDMIVAARVYFCEFLLEGLLRGNTKERYDSYAVAAGGNAPWLTRNEIRVRENMNPLPGLDDVLQPMNMGTAGQEPAGPSAPPPSGDDEAADEETDEEADARAFGEGGMLAFSANGHARGGDA